MITPKSEPKLINYEIYSEYTPGENKLELIDGKFLSDKEREKMLLLCLYNMGLKEFVRILPNESKKELINLLGGYSGG